MSVWVYLGVHLFLALPFCLSLPRHMCLCLLSALVSLSVPVPMYISLSPLHHDGLALGALGGELEELVLVDVAQQLLVVVPAEPDEHDACQCSIT